MTMLISMQIRDSLRLIGSLKEVFRELDLLNRKNSTNICEYCMLQNYHEYKYFKIHTRYGNNTYALGVYYYSIDIERINVPIWR